MMVEVLRLALALALLVVVPGFFLVHALFPPQRTHLSRLERAYLSVASGVLVLALVGVVLGFLPHGERGWFQTGATGLPLVESAMAAVALGAFAVGARRGAYPSLARRWPRAFGARLWRQS